MGIQDRLKEERHRLGLKQAEMAEAGGVQVQAVSLYESGKRYPDSQYLESIALVGVDVAYVITGHRTPIATLAKEEQALIDNYRAADTQGRAAARAVLSAVQKQKAA